MSNLYGIPKYRTSKKLDYVKNIIKYAEKWGGGIHLGNGSELKVEEKVLFVTMKKAEEEYCNPINVENYRSAPTISGSFSKEACKGCEKYRGCQHWVDDLTEIYKLEKRDK